MFHARPRSTVRSNEIGPITRLLLSFCHRHYWWMSGRHSWPLHKHWSAVHKPTFFAGSFLRSVMGGFFYIATTTKNCPIPRAYISPSFYLSFRSHCRWTNRVLFACQTMHPASDVCKCTRVWAHFCLFMFYFLFTTNRYIRYFHTDTWSNMNEVHTHTHTPLMSCWNGETTKLGFQCIQRWCIFFIYFRLTSDAQSSCSVCGCGIHSTSNRNVHHTAFSEQTLTTYDNVFPESHQSN